MCYFLWGFARNERGTRQMPIYVSSAHEAHAMTSDWHCDKPSLRTPNAPRSSSHRLTRESTTCILDRGVSALLKWLPNQEGTALTNIADVLRHSEIIDVYHRRRRARRRAVVRGAAQLWSFPPEDSQARLHLQPQYAPSGLPAIERIPRQTAEPLFPILLYRIWALDSHLRQ